MKFLNQLLGQRRLDQVRPPLPPVARLAVTTRPIFGPWGGGNQWLLQAARFLNYSGYRVRYDLRGEVDAVIIQHNGLTGAVSITFDEIAALKKARPALRVIHRINDNDIRKATTEMDALMARYNTLADHTVFISAWLRDHHAAKWFDRARPHSVILNGADPAIFHPVGSPRWQPGQPFRLVTHHWAANPMKGFPQYAALDALIADGALPGVELWIVGRWPAEITWRAAKTFPPCAGVALAERLRQCHGYVTASLWEPGGMHFIEGLQCGLPLLYHEDGGGIPELGKNYGVGFRDDIASGVRALMDGYEDFRAKTLAHPPSGDGMCLAYREIIQQVLASGRE